jgi:hypothetical protein
MAADSTGEASMVEAVSTAVVDSTVAADADNKSQ